MKVLFMIFILLPFHVLAEEVIKIDYPLNFSGVFLEPPKISKVTDASSIINQHIQENYSQEKQFVCGGVYMSTPDMELKSAYENGKVKIIDEFGYSNNFNVYKPIKQLVPNPDEKAVFNGYYFVTSNR